MINKYIELKLKTNKNSPKLGDYGTLFDILRIQPNLRYFYDTSLETLKDSDLPNIEDIFTLYDISYEKEEPLIYESEDDMGILRNNLIFFLVDLIHDSVKDSLIKNNTTETYQKFANKLERNDTVITFNYDTLVDNAIKTRFNDLNYGVKFSIVHDLFRSRFPESKDIHPNAKLSDSKKFGFPISDYDLKFSDNAPLLLKPHGSLNWLYCPKCYNYYYLLSERMIYDSYLYSECLIECGRELQRCIIPLTYRKNFQNPILNNIWVNVVRSLSKADIVYFIGYSLPDADMLSKYFFIKGLCRPNRRNCAKIVIVNPNAEKDGLDKKFRSLFGDISEVIDKSEFKEETIELGDKEFNVPQLVAEKYEEGESKLVIIKKKFKDWVEYFS